MKSGIKRIAKNIVIKAVKSMGLLMAIIFVMAGCNNQIQITTGFKDDILFKLSGREVKLSQVKLVLANEKNLYEKDFGTDIWLKNTEGESIEDGVKQSVKDKVVYLEAMYSFALEKNIGLTDEESAEIEALSTSYYEALTQEEIELLDLAQEDVYSYYEKNILAKKAYDQITSEVVCEVSDEEARVLSVMYIYMPQDKDATDTNKKRMQEAYNRLLQGADFYSTALEYTTDSVVSMDISRGDMVEGVEEQVFKLDNDEMTTLIETEQGYYIVKCVSHYLEAKTNQNKENMINAIRNKAYLAEFEEYLEGLELEFDDKKWEEISFADYKDVKAEGLLENIVLE